MIDQARSVPSELIRYKNLMFVELNFLFFIIYLIIISYKYVILSNQLMEP